MVRNPEGQEEVFTDGLGPEGTPRDIESNPSASKEALVNWESEQFGNKGDEPIDEDEPFRLIQ